MQTGTLRKSILQPEVAWWEWDPQQSGYQSSKSGSIIISRFKMSFTGYFTLNSERRNNHNQSFENCIFLYHWSCAVKQEKIWQSTIIKNVLYLWPPQLLNWLTCRNFLQIDWLLRMWKLLHGLRCSALNIEQCRAELHENVRCMLL